MLGQSRMIIFCAAAVWPGIAMAQMAPMSAPSSPADQSFAGGMSDMYHAMAAAAMTGNADQDFVAMMLPHHQGAVAMAKTELQYGKDPQLRKLARDIVAAQEKEIAQMQAWQAKHPAK